MMEDILNRLRKDLNTLSDPKLQQTSQRFFKEPIKTYGTKTAEIVKLGKTYFKEIKNLKKDEIFDLCESLWQSGYLEETFIACEWSYNTHKQFEEKDIKTFERWIDRYVTNWASCDTFCNHTVGEFIMMYPQYLTILKKWSQSNNRWMKRASAVSLIVPARKGLFLKDIFKIVDTLLLDSDDMVQKGYGWMLKVASQSHEKEVFDYVMRHKSNMPRTALRYAIEKMPKTLKIQAMAK
jgi:3-methyladenine DNA glycosylase AlkD